MKRLFFSALMAVMALFAVNASAQNVMEKGTRLVSIGLGGTDAVVPIQVGYEQGMVDNLFDSPNCTFVAGAKVGTYFHSLGGAFLGGPTGSIHYSFTPQFETYWTLMLGAVYSFPNKEWRDLGAKGKVGFSWGSYLGLRYMFTPKVGAFFEGGYGFSYGNIGVSFKL